MVMGSVIWVMGSDEGVDNFFFESGDDKIFNFFF